MSDFFINSFSVAPSGPTVTGGTITTSGGYKYHTFTGSGSLVVSDGSLTGVDIFILAGGGAGGDGGSSDNSTWYGGGGASGSYSYTTNQTLTANTYPVVIGAGSSDYQYPGSSSSFNNISRSGGQSGGASIDDKQGGSNTHFSGGSWLSEWAGGGAGIGGAGQNSTTGGSLGYPVAGVGGVGLTIFGDNYGGGGYGGGSYITEQGYYVALTNIGYGGGLGYRFSGPWGYQTAFLGENGVVNKGGGGGGGRDDDGNGFGGSGIVIVRYAV